MARCIISVVTAAAARIIVAMRITTIGTAVQCPPPSLSPLPPMPPLPLPLPTRSSSSLASSSLSLLSSSSLLLRCCLCCRRCRRCYRGCCCHCRCCHRHHRLPLLLHSLVGCCIVVRHLLSSLHAIMQPSMLLLPDAFPASCCPLPLQPPLQQKRPTIGVLVVVVHLCRHPPPCSLSSSCVIC
jgi:hypothetical protein